MQTPWFSQYLLVMAMAKLMDSERPTEDQPPGSELFAEAVHHIPPIHRFGEFGVVGAEILALTALYLQWTDKKHDAYLYVGTWSRGVSAKNLAQTLIR